jgi:RNA polymerase sigma-B factor
MTETPMAQDVRLARRHRLGDRSARSQFIERHLPFARAVAAGYRHGSEPLDDLVQVASIGLVNAVDRWDPDRGVPFRAFARPTIRGELRRHFRDTTWMIRPPRPLQELTAAIELAREPLIASKRREPGSRDFAARLGVSVRQAEAGLLAAGHRRIASIDAPRREADNEPLTLVDALGDDDPTYAEVEFRLALEQVTRDLQPSARRVLRLRFEDDLTQAQIGHRVGCSQMQVSRIIRSSLERIGAGEDFRAAA